MTTPATPSGGRRANGLPATDWGALVDLDPRLSEALLDRLRDAGVGAYVEPAGGTPDSLVRAVHQPSRPLDRLWVDAEQADAARGVVASEVRDLTALLAEEDPNATAHGFVQPVPRTTSVKVLRPPELPSPPAAEPQTAASYDDPDEAFRQIVAQFERGSDSPVPPWPVSEDVDHSRRRTDDSTSRTRRRDERSPEPEPLPGWVEPDAVEDEGHYVPPPAPPAPRLSARTVLAVAGLLLGLVLMFVPTLVGLYQSFGTGLLGVACFVGGAATLVWTVRDTPPTDRGPDDGAVV